MVRARLALRSSRAAGAAGAFAWLYGEREGSAALA